MEKILILMSTLFLATACSLFDKPEGGETPKPEKECIKITDEAVKAEVKEKHGISCKIGDWYGVGNSHCSSSEAKCKASN